MGNIWCVLVVMLAASMFLPFSSSTLRHRCFAVGDWPIRKDVGVSPGCQRVLDVWEVVNVPGYWLYAHCRCILDRDLFHCTHPASVVCWFFLVLLFQVSVPALVEKKVSGRLYVLASKSRLMHQTQWAHK